MGCRFRTEPDRYPERRWTLDERQTHQRFCVPARPLAAARWTSNRSRRWACWAASNTDFRKSGDGAPTNCVRYLRYSPRKLQRIFQNLVLCDFATARDDHPNTPPRLVVSGHGHLKMRAAADCEVSIRSVQRARGRRRPLTPYAVSRFARAGPLDRVIPK
jgi:hypothetical protein